jgi:hypothetical protein
VLVAVVAVLRQTQEELLVVLRLMAEVLALLSELEMPLL